MPDLQRLITFHVITLTRVGEENWKQHIEQTRLCPILKQELAIALTRAGFKDIKFFGGLVNTPFDPETSGNLVVSARWLPD